MDNLRLVLIVLGGVAIVALLLHGLYVMRKNNSPKEHWGQDEQDMSPPSLDFSAGTHKIEPNLDADGFDEFGVSKAKVVSKVPAPVSAPKTTASDEDTAQREEDEGINRATTQPNGAIDDIPSTNDITGTEVTPIASVLSDIPEDTPSEDRGPTYAPAVSNPKPVTHYQNKVAPQELLAEPEPVDDIPPPPASLMTSSAAADDDDKSQQQSAEGVQPSPVLYSAPTSEAGTTQSAAPDADAPAQPTTAAPESAKVSNEQVATKPAASAPEKMSFASKLFGGGRKKRAPKRSNVNEDQFSIDFDSVDPVINEAKAAVRYDRPEPAPTPKYDPNIEPEVLAISVKTDAENPITGARLLPLLLTLGLKFGDADIFHRHVNNNGKGPVLFSLANMFKPGVFDIENMEPFTTKGVTLFMTLPTESDAHQIFNMMHNAARKIAAEFSATVLDDQRNELTRDGLQAYIERIRDFEKRRLLG